MKVAIIGTRGIPNNYGGFEQFAEYLAQHLVKQGHETTVYNSHSHPYQQSSWNGVTIRHMKDPEDKMGTVGQFIYDLNCILDSRKGNFDIILQLGYTSSSIWSRLLPRDAVVITNMDGMEWKRSKYSAPVQRFLRFAEKLAVDRSDFLISDSIGIQDYLQSKYQTSSTYIPYGANNFKAPDDSALGEFGLAPYEYDMLIARLEPENSIETILQGVKAAGTDKRFIVIGKHETRYGAYLKNMFKREEQIVFAGTIYNIGILNNLRWFSRNYFHGHTVGGTNPSLLEAMASGALICAHDNIFNRSILQDNASYFTTSEDVRDVLLKRPPRSEDDNRKIENNHSKIQTTYAWTTINKQYETFMKECIERKPIEAVDWLANLRQAKERQFHNRQTHS